MRSIIEELWNGNINPVAKPYGFTEEYRSALDEVIAKREELLKAIGQENEDWVEKYEDSMNDLSACSDSNAFSKGFTLGVRMMIEIFSSNYYD